MRKNFTSYKHPIFTLVQNAFLCKIMTNKIILIKSWKTRVKCGSPRRDWNLNCGCLSGLTANWEEADEKITQKNCFSAKKI